MSSSLPGVHGWRGRHILRRGLSACCVLTLAAGLSAAVAPAADAATPNYEIVFQGSTGSLWYDGYSGATSADLGLAPGITSPSIAVTGPASYMTVFQGYTSTLWSAGTGTPDNWGLAMAPGTSPAILALPPRGSLSGGVEVAYEGTNGDLWLSGPAQTGDTGLAMAPDTSPAITGLQSGGFQVAFRASSGILWTTGTDGTYDANVFMAPGSSPTITAVNDGAVTTAENSYFVTVSIGDDQVWNVNWVASNYVLSQAGADGETTAPGTSASNNDYSFDALILTMFQGFNGDLWTSYGDSTVDTGLAMKAGTSPSLATLQNGDPVVAYQGSNGDLWVATQNVDTQAWIGADQGLGMMAGTSPAIVAYYPCSICRNQ